MDGDGIAPVLFTNPDGEWQVPQAHPSPHCPSQSPTPPLNWAVALSIAVAHMASLQWQPRPMGL